MTDRRHTHKAALLALLSDGQPKHMRDCMAVGGYRYGGRLHELRKEGHTIETIRIADDEFAYQLHAPVEARQVAFT